MVKIRDGFVSNSSSSSFMIITNDGNSLNWMSTLEDNEFDTENLLNFLLQQKVIKHWHCTDYRGHDEEKASQMYKYGY